MPKRATPLTVKQLETLPIGLHADGGAVGLYLQVTANAKSWIYRFTSPIGKSRRDMGLGPCGPITLAAARMKALAARRLVLDGIDPIDARLRERGIEQKSRIKRTTFRQAAEAYIAAHEAGWKNEKHRYQWRQSLESYAYPAIGNLAVGTIGADEVLSVLKPIWEVKTETASRLRGRIEIVLGAATAAGMREGANPALWSTLRHFLPAPGKIAKVEHHAAAGYDDMPKIMAAIRAAGTMAAKALEFTILSAARTSEVLLAQWSEVDIERSVWTVPAERMKAGREHRVPLGARAVAILREMEKVRTGEYIFQGQRAGHPLSNMALLMLLRRVGFPELTTHGFRSTFSDWVSEHTDTPAEVREMALAHAVGDKVEAAYRRGDLFEKRRELADAWAKQCDC